ncbi:unnamed protein product [Lactuca virosa]|uniref:Uncharacterized protein n=1 Tax=Lactuca virosa TaxID=75947 RepID=A0AAU9NGU5_9ASTR|nr:unnamed protein product [Lactuca virosa]
MGETDFNIRASQFTNHRCHTLYSVFPSSSQRPKVQLQTLNDDCQDSIDDRLAGSRNRPSTQSTTTGEWILTTSTSQSITQSAISPTKTRPATVTSRFRFLASQLTSPPEIGVMSSAEPNQPNDSTTVNDTANSAVNCSAKQMKFISPMWRHFTYEEVNGTKMAVCCVIDGDDLHSDEDDEGIEGGYSNVNE